MGPISLSLGRAALLPHCTELWDSSAGPISEQWERNKRSEAGPAHWERSKVDAPTCWVMRKVHEPRNRDLTPPKAPTSLRHAPFPLSSGESRCGPPSFTFSSLSTPGFDGWPSASGMVSEGRKLQGERHTFKSSLEWVTGHGVGDPELGVLHPCTWMTHTQASGCYSG